LQHQVLHVRRQRVVRSREHTIGALVGVLDHSAPWQPMSCH
jgi:hypothetical protein